jgi:hypothetical protein
MVKRGGAAKERYRARVLAYMAEERADVWGAPAGGKER